MFLVSYYKTANYGQISNLKVSLEVSGQNLSIYNFQTNKIEFNCCRHWQLYKRRSNHYYGYVWVYVGMYWYVWVWMGMYGYVWVCMDIYWYVWVYMGMCSSKCYYSLLYRTVLYCTVTLVCK